jgi:hypothetical protein
MVGNVSLRVRASPLWLVLADMKTLIKIALLVSLFCIGSQFLAMTRGELTYLGILIDSTFGIGSVDSLVRSLGQGLQILKG